MMENENQKRRFRHRRKRLIIALAAAAVILILFAAIGVNAAKLAYDKIYPGIRIGSVDVGGMTTANAAELLRESYQIDPAAELELVCGSENRSLSVSSLAPTLQFDEMAASAYSLGRSGSAFERLGEIRRIKKETVTLPLDMELNNEALMEALQSIASVVDQPEQDNQFEILENELIVTRGHSGKRIIAEHALNVVKQHLAERKTGAVELQLEQVDPQTITAEYVCETVCGEPVNASYRVENYKLVIINEKIGVSMDKAEADKIIRASTGDVIHIPVTTKKAEVTAQDIQASLFQEQLGTYTTRYNAGDRNRSHNIALACGSINEIVLAPGDVFSYNDIVGPRTAARGYREAHVYVGNKVEDGLGGGICQVSSTLYNTVVLSDLKIVTRTNHSLPVSYVPGGRDATVSYGSIDFKFENNPSQPIKLTASAGGGTTTISVYGKRDHPGRTISIESVCTGTIPAKLEQKQDPNLPEGKIQVEQKGSDGSYYQSYKITKENGTVVSREPLAKSTYLAVNRIEIVGTKPPDPVESPAPSAGPETLPVTAPEGTGAQDGGSPASDAKPDVKPVNPAA